MATDLQVILTARDTGVSRAFTEIGKDAKAAGDAIETAGKEGAAGLQQIDKAAKDADAGLDALSAAAKTADTSLDAVNASAKATGDSLERAGVEGSQGLQKVEQAARTADRSVDQVGQTARRTGVDMELVGAAAVAVGAGLVYAGNAALDQQQTIIGLQSAYGDAAAEMISFADQVASTSIFNDDDILKGERYFATLRTQYDLSIEQIQQLMQTTADLASASGTSFEDASSRVTAAIRGEAEAAEYLGLTLNQQSIDRGNLTLSMTNQEAAQFRLTALNDQAAQFSGTAARLAESEVGARAKLTNAIQDNAQALGQYVGPYTAIIGGAATGAVGLAQFAGGFGALAAGIRTATTASLAFVASPIGLTVTAVGGALALATGAFLSNKNAAAETAAEWAEADASAVSLTETINQMALAGDAFGSRFAQSLSNSLGSQIDWYKSELEDVTKGSNLDSTFGQNIVASIPENLLGPAAAAERESYINALMPTADDEIRLNTALTSLVGLFNNPNINTPQLQREMQAIFDEFDRAEDGSRSVDSLVAAYERLYQQQILYAQGMTAAERATNDLTTAQENWQALGAGSIGAMTEEMGQYEQAIVRAASSSRELALAERERKDARGDHAREAAAEQDDFWAEQRRLAEEGHEADRQRAEDRRAAAEEARSALGQQAAGYSAIVAEQERAAASADAFAESMANIKSRNLEIAAEQLDALQQAQIEFVGNGDNILDWWMEYQDVVATSVADVLTTTDGLSSGMDQGVSSASALETVTGGLVTAAQTLAQTDPSRPFRELVEMAADVGDSAGAMDAVLATFGRIDALGQRYESAGSIADALVGEPGEWAVIDDLITQGRISQEEYNAALTAGVGIQTNQGEVQSSLNTIRAMQIPLLAEESAAYQDNIRAISELDAVEQRRVLMLQDTAVQSQIATLYSQAYAASVGEIPEEVATRMILEAAEADAGLKDLLLNLGLITEEEGVIKVNFPDADATIGAIDRMTLAFLHFQAIADNTTAYELAVEIYGEEEARELFGMIDENDGKTATTTITADDQASGTFRDVDGVIRSIDGTVATATINAIDTASGTTRDAQGVIRSTDSVVGTGRLTAIDTASGTTRDAQGVIRSLTGKSVTLTAIDNASGAARAAASAISALKSKTVTLTTNYRAIYSSQGRGPTAEAHGGIAGYALGGNVIPIWAGEGDRPEIAHFATGGSALIPREGMYNVPVGTYIEPSNSARASISAPGAGGGVTVIFNVAGSVLGVDDFLDQVIPEISTVVTRAVDRQDRSLGVTR